LRDFEKIEIKLTQEKERYADAATLVRESLDGILEDGISPDLLESAQALTLNLEDLYLIWKNDNNCVRKKNKIVDWDKNQRKMLLNVILEQIKTHLNVNLKKMNNKCYRKRI